MACLFTSLTDALAWLELLPDPPNILATLPKAAGKVTWYVLVLETTYKRYRKLKGIKVNDCCLGLL